MARFNVLLVLIGILIAAGLVTAGCAASAYTKTCASCQFDANGKVDSACSGGYKASGTACVSSSYPIMSAKYAAGQCPAVDSCASELQSCAAQYSSGNDKADCQEGSVAVCYSAADSCVKSAAIKCGEVEKQCGTPELILLLTGLGLAFVKIKG
ncbi:MAG: hypothetical protein V1492_04585 [Candidatus Micrarchaeota archaeon]